MTGYKIVNLQDLIAEIGEDSTKRILSDFSCPLNQDVEDFLRIKAIEFTKQRLSQTHLVYASFRGKPVLVGYFTLAMKEIIFAAKKLKGSLKHRVKRFAQFSKEAQAYRLAAPLIAQLGKNYANGYDRLISGDELLFLACEKVAQAQIILGGRYAYLECEDKPRLLDFYERNGFCAFDRRNLDPDETGMSGEYLIQLLKYIK